MISDELLNKFDRIEDLPVSEEMLGAYLEDNLDSFEASKIESVISENSNLSDFVAEVSQEDIGSILDNLEHQILDPSYPVFISDLHLPNFDNNTTSIPLYEDYMVAACCPEIFFNDLNTLFSDDSISSDDLLAENLSHEDSFLGSDQSLDIDSHESDDMFNEDSIDI